jgi:hypothetical protein
MTKEPLYQEPGMNKLNSKNESDIFNEIIQYKNIDVAIIDILVDKYGLFIYNIFCEKVIELFLINKDAILNNIESLKNKISVKSCNIYKMNIIINKKLLLERFSNINV